MHASTELSQLKKLLRENGYSVTKPRVRLFEILQNHNTLTIHELISILCLQDQATIYRNIKVFEKLGILRRLQLGWHSRLELSDIFQYHHHHLTCIKCNRVIALTENKIIETQITNMTNTKGFLPIDHQLEIRGICNKCN